MIPVGEPEGRAGEGPAPGDSGRATLSRVRVGVGLLLAVIVVLVLVLDVLLSGRAALAGAAPGTGLLVALLSAAAVRETCDLLARAGIPAHAAWAAWSSFLLLALRSLLPAGGVRPGDAAALAMAGLLLAALAPAAMRIAWRREDGPEGGNGAAPVDLRLLGGTALALVAVHLPMALLLELRLAGAVPGMAEGVPHGLVLATMVVLACKVGDSAAYFAGRTVGRHSLCWVSPQKTWEGAAAGVVAGTAAGGMLGAAFGLPIPHALAFGLVTNLAGQGGDLLESWLKRCAGAKDSGRTFGEMGGALDLIDALLLAGPAGFAFHRIVLA